MVPAPVRPAPDETRALGRLGFDELGRAIGGPAGVHLGISLVLQPSASGRSRSRRIGFEDENGRHVGGAHHFALLNHPQVYECLREWLATAPCVPAP
jgi:hypothetical protein